MNPKFLLKNVYKGFGSHEVLQGVNLEVLPGESLVIIGASGTGKSVLLKCLLGLLHIDSGTLEMNGNSIREESSSQQEARLKNIGVVFQGSALFDSLTVWENVAFRLLYAERKPRGESKQRALESLAAVGLSENVATLYPAEISGGMARRVALARAITSHPHVLFFDEPTAGLDPIFSRTISELIRKSVEDLEVTALTITHDMASARIVGDRIAMLHEGKIIWCGKASAIDTCKNPYVQQFIHGRSTDPQK